MPSGQELVESMIGFLDYFVVAEFQSDRMINPSHTITFPELDYPIKGVFATDYLYPRYNSGTLAVDIRGLLIGCALKSSDDE